jgi:hypothetical protein
MESYADQQTFADAAQAAAVSANAQALAERVAQAGRAPGVNVTGADAVGAVVTGVQEQVSAWVGAQLAAGASSSVDLV